MTETELFQMLVLFWLAWIWIELRAVTAPFRRRERQRALRAEREREAALRVKQLQDIERAKRFIFRT